MLSSTWMETIQLKAKVTIEGENDPIELKLAKKYLKRIKSA